MVCTARPGPGMPGSSQGGKEKAAWPPQPGHFDPARDLRAAPDCPEALSCCQSSKPASPFSGAFLASSLNHQ